MSRLVSLFLIFWAGQGITGFRVLCLPKNTNLRDFEVDHAWLKIGRRNILISAHHLSFEESAAEMILLAINTETATGNR